jgi:phage gpG-like protein
MNPNLFFEGNVDTKQVQRALMGAVIAHRGQIGILLDAIGGIMVKSMHKTFNLEGRPRKWKGLAESTKKAYRRRGRSPEEHKLLQDEGDLIGSLTHEVDRVNTGVKWGYGDNVDYGIYHQQGTRKMPSRKFITSSDGEEILYPEDRAIIFRVIEDYTRDCFKRAAWMAKI